MEGSTLLDPLLDGLEKKRAERQMERLLLNQGSDVYLNVYDMVWLNDYTSRFGIGAFHSGVQVHEREYAYGGHSYSYTGVYDVKPGAAADIAGKGLKFRQAIYLGHTALSSCQVHELVYSVGKEFNGNIYHIFDKNCNHFASSLSLKLCGAHTPHWINRLAYMGSWMPFLLNCLPLAWVTPTDPEVEGQTSSRQLCSASPRTVHPSTISQDGSVGDRQCY